MIIGITGVVIGQQGLNIGGNLDTTMSAMPFFCIGFVLNQHTSILRPNKYDKYIILFILLFFFVAWLCSLCGSVNYKNNEYYMSIPLVYIGGVAGTLGVLYMAKLFNSLPLISYCGRYSIIILVTHQPMIGLYKIVCARLGIIGYLELFLSLALMMLSYLLIIPFMIKFFPHVCGLKNMINIER